MLFSSWLRNGKDMTSDNSGKNRMREVKILALDYVFAQFDRRTLTTAEKNV
jgi:hypothetical protein